MDERKQSVIETAGATAETYGLTEPVVFVEDRDLVFADVPTIHGRLATCGRPAS
jgi:hypothetical protein